MVLSLNKIKDLWGSRQKAVHMPPLGFSYKLVNASALATLFSFFANSHDNGNTFPLRIPSLKSVLH